MNYSEACAQLGLESDVELTDSALKRAFKKAALKHHPDKNLQEADVAKAKFQRISTAYEFLNECVARGQTGPNAPRFATSDNPLFEGDGDEYYYYDDDDDEEEEEYVDLSEVLFNMFFNKMASRGGGGTFGGFTFGGGGGIHFRATPSGFSSTPHGYDQYDSYEDYGTYEDEDDDDSGDWTDEMFAKFEEKARRKDEARQKAKERERAHTQYMAERARQAELEGRDFFESWNIKQLSGECKRRGISLRGLSTHEKIVEALVQDEKEKRIRTKLKEQAPLLDEWAEVILMKKNAQWNGMKVRVIDFFADMDKYLIEWDLNASKKKTKGYMRESKTARIKPDNLRLWGTGEPIHIKGGTSNVTSGSDKEKSKQQQKGKKKSKRNSNKSSDNDKPSDKDNAKEKQAKKPATTTAPPEEQQAKKPATGKPSSEGLPNTKCCAICHKEHNLEASDDNDKVVVLPCGHIFCAGDCCGDSYLPDKTSNLEIRSCRVCHKCDPGVEALQTLPYIQDLLEVPQTVTDVLYKEYSLRATCESVEKLEVQQEKEIQALDLQKAKSLKEQKDQITKANHGKMNKEKKGKLTKQAQASAEEEFGPKRKELLRKHEQLWRSVAKTDTLKDLHEQRDAATEAATSAINKHFRRASIKVHPDRHGDKFQKEFDALTKAKNTLSDVELRHNYMEQMLEIVCTVGTHWVPSSHKSWVEKHQPDMTEQKPTTKKSDAPGNQAPLQIEGGLMHTKPRRPAVAILSAKERRVRVTLRIPGNSSYEFLSYTTALHIIGERGDVYNEEFEEEYKKTIGRKDFNCKGEGEIEVDLVLPEAGMWDVRWMYTIEMEPGRPHDSERSTDTTVDLVSPKYKAQWKLMKSFESVAARRTKEIHAALRKLKNTTTGDHANIQNRYETLQEATLKAKQTEWHLSQAMNKVGANMTATDTPLTLLRSALAETRPFKEELDKAMVVYEKKVAYKNFKQSVYDILETGDGSAWVALVTEEALKDEMKGDANRLYQLLMEGKKAYNLDLVDGATLFVASDRKDLFSAKQLKALCERSETVEVRAEEEARLLMIHNEKKESAEKELESLQLKAALMDCERGELVQITGLKSEPALNGRLATYMGLGQGERFNVLLDEGREIALRKHNFRKYDGVSVAKHGPKPPRIPERWACKFCTYLHEGPHVERLSACSICGTSRNSSLAKVPEQAAKAKAATPSQNNETSTEKKASLPAQQGAQRLQQPKTTFHSSKKQTKTVAPENKSAVESRAKKTTQHSPPPKTTTAEAVTNQTANVSALPGTKLSPKPSTSECSTKKHSQQGINLAQYAETTEKLMGQSVKNQEVAPHQPKNHTFKSHDSAKYPTHIDKPAWTSTSPSTKSVPPQEPVDIHITPLASNAKPSTRKDPKRCRRGIDCVFLKKGKCRFQHTPEEIAAVSGNASKKVAPKNEAHEAESLNTHGAATIDDTGSTRKVEITILVDNKIAGGVIGKSSMYLKSYSKKSGALVKAGKKSTPDGMCRIKIRGSSQESVDKAASMVLARMDKLENRGAVPERVETSSCSTSTVPSIIHGAATSQTPMAQTTASSPAKLLKPKSDLLVFLESHDKAIKCSPDIFVSWLASEDIETLSDLKLAIEDEYFVEELLRAGLKKFKMVAFLQSLETMLDSTRG